jgi:HK97 family phage portal protein
MSGKTRRSTPWNIDDPADNGSGREDWLYQLVISWLIRGNAFGLETSWDVRTGRGMTVTLLSPDKVKPQKISGDVHWFVEGKEVVGEKLAEFRHWPVSRHPGTLLGPSVVERHALSIGISLRSAQFGDQWFREGAHPSSALVNKAALSTVDAETAKRRLIDATHGSREPLVLGEGWTFEQMQLSPNESQFLETQKYSESQCARMFGPGFAEILGYETGGSMTYANVADRDLQLAKYSLNKWIRRAERVLTGLLPPSTQRVQLNREGLLEATTLQRYQSYASALQNQWRTVNEVRAIEDLPPVPWGDVPTEPKTQTSQGVTNGNAAQS